MLQHAVKSRKSAFLPGNWKTSRNQGDSCL